MLPATWVVLSTALTLADPIVLEPPDPIAGVVVDEGGRPVEGVEAMLAGMVFGGEAGLHWRGRTDAAGRFQANQSGWFASGRLPLRGFPDLLAYRPGSRIVRVKVDALSPPTPDRPARLVLRPARGVSVQVIGPDGKAIAGAVVSIKGPSIHLIPRELGVADVTTDSEGVARFADLSPEDSVAFEVRTTDFGVQSFNTLSFQPLVQIVALNPVGRISGRVVAEDPAQAAGIVIRGSTLPGNSVGQGGFRATTDADGRFDIPCVAHGSVIFASFAPADDVVLVPPKGLTLEAGGHVTAEFRLQRGIPVRGSIRERGTERPIAGASVNVISSAGGDGLGASSAKEVRSDAAGRFVTHLLAGQVGYRLGYAGEFVIPSGAQTARFINPLATLAEGAEGLDLPPIEVVHGVDVSGIVVDEAGKPASGAHVTAWGPGGDTVAGGTPTYRMPLVTDNQGQFVAKHLAPGAALEWSAVLGDSASGPPDPIAADVSKPIRLVIGPGHTMSLGGRVLDEDGHPVSGAAVKVNSRHATRAGGLAWHYTSDSGDWNLRTDGEGRFQTPRQLETIAWHRAEVRTIGKRFAVTDWVDSTADAFPDIILTPLSSQSNRFNP